MLGIGIGSGTPAGAITATGGGTPFTTYNGLALSGQGVPPIVAATSLPTQGFAVFNTSSTVNLLAAAPAGTYRISFYIVITTTFVTNTSVTFTISWTDDQGARSVVTTLGAPTLTAGTTAQVSQLIRSTGATAISYKPGVTGTAATAGAASFSVVLEQLV